MSVDLTTGIVHILKPDGTSAGAGFVLDYDLVATCSHVIKNGVGVGPGDTVHLIFYFTRDEATALVEPNGWCDPDAEDIAILRLIRPLPRNVVPLPLGPSIDVAGHHFKTFGFPDVEDVDGLFGYGTLGDRITIGGQTVLQLTGTTEVTTGFSGGPVLDEVTQKVVGMVTAIAMPDKYGKLSETAFIIPTETLLKVCHLVP
jgi:hypothetical protein